MTQDIQSINELKSYTEYTVSTPTSVFPVGFRYNYNVDRINVYVDGVEATVAGYTITHDTHGTLELTPAVPSGVVLLQRETNIDGMLHTFSAGAKFITGNMDEDFQQVRHSQQEVRDAFEFLSDDFDVVAADTATALSNANTALTTANTANALANTLDTSIGQPNGIASLDATGKVPAGQLPEYVDDVQTVTTFAALPITPAVGVLYIVADTDQLYRWTGTAYQAVGGASGTIESANKLTTPRSISATGDATWSTNFDGSTNVTAALTLADTGVSAGTYGNASSIPVIQVDAKGRVITASTTAANYIPTVDKGVANGVATLGADGLITPTQLPTASTTVKGVAEIATQTEVNTATDDGRVITPLKLLAGVKKHLNVSGDAPMYACRAWVNFNGTGTPSISASGNVRSITDNGTGDYSLNFTQNMPDGNYVVSELHGNNGGQHASYIKVMDISYIRLQFTIDASNSYPAVDPSLVTVAVFR